MSDQEILDIPGRSRWKGAIQYDSLERGSACGAGAESGCGGALESLCRSYWYPLFSKRGQILVAIHPDGTAGLFRLEKMSQKPLMTELP